MPIKTPSVRFLLAVLPSLALGAACGPPQLADERDGGEPVDALHVQSSALLGPSTDSDLVVVERGTLPILLTAPHGGKEPVPGVEVDRCPADDAGVREWCGDGATFDLTLQIADQIEARLGGRPYIVMARFTRQHLDANRTADAAYGEPEAELHYRAYHDAVRRFVDELRAAYPSGHPVLYDIHGQSTYAAQVHRGTKNGLSVSDLRAVHGDPALLGPDSVFGRLTALGIEVFPNGTPVGAPPELINGMYSVTNYGSHNADGIDTIQIEVGGEYRAPEQLSATAAALGQAISHYTRRYVRHGITLVTQATGGVEDGPGDDFGRAVATGDFNGDGRQDLAVAAPGADTPGAADAGAVMVHFGTAGGLGSRGAQRLTQELAGAVGQTGDRFGQALASGDFDGDGFEDLAVGVPFEDYDGASNAGIVIVFRGSPSGLGGAGWERFGQEVSGAEVESGDNFGWALVAADFNGDGYDDLAVGVPGEDYDGAANAGLVISHRGSPSGLLPAGCERLGQEASGADVESGDHFGRSLAAGDLDGDGYDDLVVGVPFEDYDGAVDAGLVIALYGSAAGLLPARAERVGQEASGAEVEVGDHFGWALAVGDFDGDGKDDLAASLPDEDYDGATDAGLVVILRGSSGGLLPARWERFGQEVVEAGVELGDRFGAALVAGDFDGDQRDDLAIGVPGENVGGAFDTGMVVVLKGAPTSLLPPRFQRLGQTAIGGRDEPQDTLGAALAAGDFDGDGRSDLAAAAPGEEVRGLPGAGQVLVFRGAAGGMRVRP